MLLMSQLLVQLQQQFALNGLQLLQQQLLLQLEFHNSNLQQVQLSRLPLHVNSDIYLIQETLDVLWLQMTIVLPQLQLEPQLLVQPVLHHGQMYHLFKLQESNSLCLLQLLVIGIDQDLILELVLDSLVPYLDSIRTQVAVFATQQPMDGN